MWCLKKPGRDLREKVELALAWKRVAREVAEGTLGGEFDRSDRAELQSKVKDAEEAAKDEVWGDYRFAVLADGQEADGLKVIDLGAGHSSSGETLCGRVIAALKSEALLNESVGAGYIERNWPPALKDSGAWPLASLRQSFLNGSLTRLVDPDAILKSKIVEFVTRGDFGLGVGQEGRWDLRADVVPGAGCAGRGRLRGRRVPAEEGNGRSAQSGAACDPCSDSGARTEPPGHADIRVHAWSRTRNHQLDADAAPLGQHPSRSMESSGHEDPSEAPLGFRT